MSDSRLCEALTHQIISSIRAGGYPYIAAEAWGLSRDDFDDWMRRKEPAYADFAARVKQAHAQARLRAETEAFSGDPKVWLERGPGRETADRPGWSTAVKAAERVLEPANVLMHPEFMELVRLVCDNLQPFPDACDHFRTVSPLQQIMNEFLN